MKYRMLRNLKPQKSVFEVLIKKQIEIKHLKACLLEDYERQLAMYKAYEESGWFVYGCNADGVLEEDTARIIWLVNMIDSIKEL